MKKNKSSITTIIGPSTCGKTNRIIVPQILEAIAQGQSFLVCDPKNQILDYIGEELNNNSYKIICVDLREPNKSMCWNPLILPYKMFVDGHIQDAYSCLTDIAKNIYISLGNSQKDFWDSSAYGFFVALANSLYGKAQEEEINLKSILNMTIYGEERFGASNYMKEYFNLEPSNSYSYLCAHNVINAPSDTKGGILSTFKNSLQKLLVNDKYENILCFNDFDFDDCMQDKVSIILKYEDENLSNVGIITVFIDMFYKYLINKRTMNPKDDIYYFFLDDLLSLSPLYSFDNMILSAKSRNISLSIVINNRSLFQKIYSKESMNSLLSNSDNIFYFQGNDIKIHKYFIELCRQKGKALELNVDGKILFISEKEVPKLLNLSCTPKCHYDYLYVNKHMDEKIKVFSFKEYVKEQKQKKMYESINEDNMFLYPNFVSQTSFQNSKKVHKDIKGLVADIDKKIQELVDAENENV